MTLELRLSAMGFHCWLDQNAATITKESMKNGVKDSKVLVKYVSRIACTKVLADLVVPWLFFLSASFAWRIWQGFVCLRQRAYACNASVSPAVAAMDGDVRRCAAMCGKWAVRRWRAMDGEWAAFAQVCLHLYHLWQAASLALGAAAATVSAAVAASFFVAS